MRTPDYYIGRLRSILKGNSKYPERADALSTARTAYRLGSLIQAIQFIELRIEMGLENHPDRMFVFNQVLVLSYSLINAKFEQEEKTEKVTSISSEHRQRMLVERSMREREERTQKPQAVEAFKQRHQQRQGAIVAAGERVLHAIQCGCLE